jgi:hypothetical protein
MTDEIKENLFEYICKIGSYKWKVQKLGDNNV